METKIFFKSSIGSDITNNFSMITALKKNEEDKKGEIYPINNFTLQDISQETENIKLIGERKNYVKKLREKVKKFFEKKLDDRKNSFTELTNNIDELAEKRNFIYKSIINIDNKLKNIFMSILEEVSAKLNELYKKIIQTRKNNFKTFDNRVKQICSNNNYFKKLKKKLYLLMNILKLRILIYPENCERKQENIKNHYFNEEEKEINKINNNANIKADNEINILRPKVLQGYFINIEKNFIKPIEVDKHMTEHKKAVLFWNSFYECFKEETK